MFSQQNGTIHVGAYIEAKAPRISSIVNAKIRITTAKDGYILGHIEGAGFITFFTTGCEFLTADQLAYPTYKQDELVQVRNPSSGRFETGKVYQVRPKIAHNSLFHVVTYFVELIGKDDPFAMTECYVLHMRRINWADAILQEKISKARSNLATKFKICGPNIASTLKCSTTNAAKTRQNIGLEIEAVVENLQHLESQANTFVANYKTIAASHGFTQKEVQGILQDARSTVRDAPTLRKIYNIYQEINTRRKHLDVLRQKQKKHVS